MVAHRELNASEHINEIRERPPPFNLSRFLHDERDGSYCGRTPSSWGKKIATPSTSSSITTYCSARDKMWTKTGRQPNKYIKPKVALTRRKTFTIVNLDAQILVSINSKYTFIYIHIYIYAQWFVWLVDKTTIKISDIAPNPRKLHLRTHTHTHKIVQVQFIYS